MEHGIITQHQRGMQFRQAQQGVDFGNTQRFGQAVADFRAIDICQRIGCQRPAIPEKTEKGTESRQPAGVGPGADLMLPAMMEVPDHLLGGDTLRARWRVRRTEEIEKGPEVSAVGGNRIFSQPSLDGQVLQKEQELLGER